GGGRGRSSRRSAARAPTRQPACRRRRGCARTSRAASAGRWTCTPGTPRRSSRSARAPRTGARSWRTGTRRRAWREHSTVPPEDSIFVRGTAKLMNIVLVGPGRAGHALRDRAIAYGHAARLVRDPAEAARADVVLLTVPDRAIGEVAASLPATQWVGHVSGATPLAALGASPRRF